MTSSALLEHYQSLDLNLIPAPEGQDLHYPRDHGDPVAELRAAETGAALFDATGRGLLTVKGADALDLLQRLLAGDVRELAAGQVQENLLLTPKGRVRFHFRLGRGADGLRISTAPGESAPLASALESFVFAEDVQFALCDEDHAPMELLGPGSEAILQGLFGEAAKIPLGTCVQVRWNDVAVELSHCKVLGKAGWVLDPGKQAALGLWQALVESGATAAGLGAREVLRVRHLVALGGAELSQEQEQAPYPQEALLEDALSLSKGCYVGQEVVAKLDTYGGLNRRLTAFQTHSTEALAPGTTLRTAGGEEVGTVTTWCTVPSEETALLLAYLKLRHADEGPFCAGPNGVPLESLVTAH